MSERPLAVVTGASGGMGAEFARQLASSYDLVLIARSTDKLERVKASVAGRGPQVSTVSADLSTSDGVRATIDRVEGLGRPVDLLVNNAGSGKHGPFVGVSPADCVDQVLLDVAAVVALTRAFLPGMIAAGRGGVINVGSTAGFQPTPGLSTYAAAKAFVLSLTEALAVELRGTGVVVTVVAPGTVDTGFFAAAGARFRVGGMMSAPDVVGKALQGHAAGRTLVVPGVRNRLSTLGARVLPRGLMAQAAGWVARALGERTSTAHQRPSIALAPGRSRFRPGAGCRRSRPSARHRRYRC